LETLFFAFVHDTRRGLAQGGLRFSKYNSLADLLVDGLRLSQGMTRKNALAGLWWGGGKGIMAFPPDIDSPEQLKAGSDKRRAYFEAYGRFIASLGGIYYTAEDVGTNTDDMNALLSKNRFTTCVSSVMGGSGNPSPFTARGVFKAMQAAWKVISGTDDLKGVKVSVQGAGNVGYPLIKLLYETGAKIWFSDMSETRIKELLEEMPELTLVKGEEIFDLDVDVFAPCAIGAQVNSQTIPRLKVKLVCGAANNILKEPEADSLALKKEI
jgi:leucine dehydrogenase